jgi:phosphate-selective porin OprO/OprP
VSRLIIAAVLLSTSAVLAQPAPDGSPPEVDPATVPEPPPAPAAIPAPATIPAPAPRPTGAIAGIGISTDATATGKPPKPLELKPGGYIQSDARMFANDSGAREITIRRLRFKLDGTAYKIFRFRTLIDFAGSKVVVDDAWGELALRPELALRFGKDKGQLGIERLQSASQLTFIERSYPTQLAPNRDIGVALRGELARGVVHYSIAAVDGVADNAVIEGETDDELEYNAHLLVSPFKAAASKKYGDLAIGGAATFGRAIGTAANPGLTPLRSAGQATIAKYATGADDATTARVEGYRNRLAVHAYYFGGPIGALAEYVRDRQKVAFLGDHTDLTHQAWQIAASVAVTPGDRPTYKGLQPTRPFDPDRGTWGALELAARYAELRFDPAAFDAGISSRTSSIERARAATLGVNWYFNEFLKLQLDYEATVFRGGAMTGDRPTEHLIATRLQASI